MDRDYSQNGDGGLMRSIVQVTTAPEHVALTTLDRVKLELGITTEASDDLLRAKILEASSDIEAQCQRNFAAQGMTERFWGDPGCAEYFSLRQYPVTSVTSVTVDDVAVDSDEYRLDAETGLLYRLDASGYPCIWQWCKDVVIVYAGGYAMPESESPNLPASLQAACVLLMNSYWSSRGRDPALRAEDIPGLGSATYWVGAVGESGQLPPEVMSRISPFRRPSA